MEYHFIPGKKQSHENDLIEGSKTRSSKMIANYKKSHKSKFKQAELAAKSHKAFCLEEPGDLNKVLSEIKNQDQIVIHGEGEPFIIGFEEPTHYDLFPHKLVDLLIQNGLPKDLEVTIDLKACHSGCDYKETNFARDTAILLGQYGYDKIKVIGYTGLITEKISKNQIKFSCYADPKPMEDVVSDSFGQGIEVDRTFGKNVKHSCLQDASVVYNSKGEAHDLGTHGHINPLSDLSKKPFLWEEYIKRYKQGFEESMAKSQNLYNSSANVLAQGLFSHEKPSNVKEEEVKPSPRLSSSSE